MARFEKGYRRNVTLGQGQRAALSPTCLIGTLGCLLYVVTKLNVLPKPFSPTRRKLSYIKNSADVCPFISLYYVSNSNHNIHLATSSV